MDTTHTTIYVWILHQLKESQNRNSWLKISISQEEKEAIDKKFCNSGLRTKSEFVRAMIFTGLIVYFSEDNMKQIMRDFSSASNNINQIAMRVNRTDNLYTDDLAQLKESQSKMNTHLMRMIGQLHFLKKSTEITPESMKDALERAEDFL